MYVEQPTGFINKGKESYVYRLEMALYGLKQAPRAWYGKIDRFFREKRYTRSPNESTLYYKHEEQGMVMVSRYVDDMIHTGSSWKLIQEFKNDMEKKINMIDLRELQFFQGLGG